MTEIVMNFRSVPNTLQLLSDFQPAGQDYNKPEVQCSKSLTWTCNTPELFLSTPVSVVFAGGDTDFLYLSVGPVAHLLEFRDSAMSQTLKYSDHFQCQ